MVDIMSTPEDERVSEGNRTHSTAHFPASVDFPANVNVADDDVCLLDSTTENTKATPEKETKIQMTITDAERLITYLNDAADNLSLHLDELKYMEKRRFPILQDSRCVKLKGVCSRFIGKFTGAKGISATVLLQLICLIMLTLVDSLPKDDEDKRKALEFGSVAMLIIQTLNLLIVILISVQLLSQIQKREVTRILLAQSYIATVLLFSGIYTAAYRMYPKSWKFVSDPEINTSPVLIVKIYTKFLFFSVSTATLCGAADSLPNEWYTSLFVSAQMLLSFMYFTSVLGTTLSKRRRPAPRLRVVSKELLRFHEHNGRRL